MRQIWDVPELNRGFLPRSDNLSGISARAYFLRPDRYEQERKRTWGWMATAKDFSGERRIGVEKVFDGSRIIVLEDGFL